jgi:hypothetical protein
MYLLIQWFNEISHLQQSLLLLDSTFIPLDGKNI